MTCPRCDAIDLVPEERHEITIDRCPRCGGVWLDHGELEKIVAFIRQFEPRTVSGSDEPHEAGSAVKAARGRIWDALQDVLSWLPWG